MRVFFDMLLIVVSTIVMYKSFVLVTSYRSKSISDFCILLLYMFQILPVLMDYIIGRPQYKTWYEDFRIAIDNDYVSIIYDIYILILFFSLNLVSKKARMLYDEQNLEIKYAIPDLFLWLMVWAPYLYIILSGTAGKYLFYGSSGARGLSADVTTVVSNLIILGVFSSQILYFKNKRNLMNALLLFLYSFTIIWISGKRYIVATIVFCFFYMYIVNKKKEKHQLNAKYIMIFSVVAIIVYSVYYITNIKVTSNGTWQDTYAMTRIDFGRDDVVKFTIMREYFQRDHILEYPLQTIISTVFMIVPRKIFPNKSYPHYRYLTASLYHTTVLSIPAGMTPSILEMFISNFRYLGMPLCIIFLCWFCKKADREINIEGKFVYAFVLMGMLTQNMDALIFIFYVWIYLVFKGVKIDSKKQRIYTKGYFYKLH